MVTIAALVIILVFGGAALRVLMLIAMGGGAVALQGVAKIGEMCAQSENNSSETLVMVPSADPETDSKVYIKSMSPNEELKHMGLRGDPEVEKLSFGQRRTEYSKRFNALSEEKKRYVKKLREFEARMKDIEGN